jgi:ectoine hydroxylase-related dioxygenase (phytanoyl-CoA dioxygenase family)
VRVVELTGAPGDVVLWHPSLFHAASPNASSRPGFMLTDTALRRTRGSSG